MSIKVEGLNYIYSQGTAYEIKALDNINLNIEDGEFIGIIGHTGSGKSTLIQHLSGLIKATSGAIYYNGKNIYDEDFKMKDLRSKVGLVFQYPEYQLFEVDVFSDVCFGPKNLGLSKEEIEARANKALQAVGLKEKYYKYSPFELSGGQKRRVAIAGVLAMKPKVLILDEPTNHMDLISKDILKQALQAYDGTLVIVSHDRDFLDGLVDKIYEFKDGKVKEHLGGVQDFLARKRLDNFSELERKAPSSATAASTAPQQIKAEAQLSYQQMKEIEREKSKLKKKIQQCEARIEELEGTIAQLEEELGSATDTAKILELTAKYDAAKRELDAKMEEWAELSE